MYEENCIGLASSKDFQGLEHFQAYLSYRNGEEDQICELQ